MCSELFLLNIPIGTHPLTEGIEPPSLPQMNLLDEGCRILPPIATIPSLADVLCISLKDVDVSIA